MRERAKRKRPCRCSPEPPGTVLTPCGHRGNCTEWRCHDCGKLRFSAGPAWCPCDGYVRWLRYPGMDNPTRHWDPVSDEIAEHHVPVKPGKARRFQGGRHNRKRRLYCKRLRGRREDDDGNW